MATPTYPKPGTLIAGKYRVERVLGQGGMGVVVAAEHTLLKQRVALKFVLDATDPGATGRFMREARATARLESEHVCRVMDVGTTETGAPYIVMEMLSGMDLSARLVAFGPLAVSDAVEYVLQLLDALAEAHARGIVHRDLKPSNLFLATRGDGSSILKILDFGISKLQAAHDPITESTARGLGPADPLEQVKGLTATGVMMGSPPFMSPEQLRSARDVDERCDLWSVGAILYELLTGERAFRGGHDLFTRILSGRYAPLCEGRPALPAALEKRSAGSTRRQRATICSSAAALASALAPFGPAHAKVHVERAKRWEASAGAGAKPEVEPSSPAPSLPAPSAGVATVHGVALAPQSARSAQSSGQWWPRVAMVAVGVAMVMLVVVVRMQPASAPTSTAAGTGLVASPLVAVDPVPTTPTPAAPPPSTTIVTALSEPSASAASAASAARATGVEDAGPRRPAVHQQRPVPARPKPAASSETVDLGRL